VHGLINMSKADDLILIIELGWF